MSKLDYWESDLIFAKLYSVNFMYNIYTSHELQFAGSLAERYIFIALTVQCCLSGDERQLHQDVWAVEVLADGVMVSGDSGGNVQFWDPAHGTLISSFRQHQADVLTIAASPAGDILFASGADPQVSVFKRIPGGKGGSLNEEVQALYATKVSSHNGSMELAKVRGDGNYHISTVNLHASPTQQERIRETCKYGY